MSGTDFPSLSEEPAEGRPPEKNPLALFQEGQKMWEFFSQNPDIGKHSYFQMFPDSILRTAENGCAGCEVSGVVCGKCLLLSEEERMEARIKPENAENRCCDHEYITWVRELPGEEKKAAAAKIAIRHALAISYLQENI